MSFSDIEDAASFQPFQNAQPSDDESQKYDEKLASSTDEASDDLCSTANAPESQDGSEDNSQAALASSTEDTAHLDEQLLSATDESHLSVRPNKYDGPPSTWRSWAAEERQLAASLEQLNAKDLSLHLYIAHNLKQRAWREDVRLKLSTDVEDAVLSGQVWKPPRDWTAWPLTPDVVPREDDDPRWSEKDFSYQDKSHGRKKCQFPVLKELLIAQVLKRAKQRRARRSYQESKPDSEPESQSISPTEDVAASNDGDELEPVTMLDDEIAEDLLQPAVHHILAKLDHLLVGLHHARNAYTGIDNPALGSYDDESNESHDDESGRSGQRKRKRSISRSSGDRLHSSDSMTSGPEPIIRSVNRSTSRPARSRKRSRSSARENRPFQKHMAHCGLRDWSDVLGVASMTGWDSKAVEKAAFRCSKIFGEGIILRKLNEHGDESNEMSILPNTPYPDSESSIDETERNDGEGWRLYCPVTVCPRSSRGFSTNYELKRHFKQVHHGPVEPSDEEMIGGVHVDGFMQPIPAVAEWIGK